MPNYSNLSTQIEAIKSEISSSLAASAYSAQDLVYVAKALQALGTVVAPDGVSNITVNDNIYLGSTAEAFVTTAALTNPNLVIVVNETDYAQIAFSNRSSNANASTDIILYHQMPDSTENQIIGRANRIGRKYPLNVHHLHIQD